MTTFSDADSTAGFITTIYDPTNGTISTGNVYRAGGYFTGPGSDAARFVSSFAPSSVNGG